MPGCSGLRRVHPNEIIGCQGVRRTRTLCGALQSAFPFADALFLQAGRVFAVRQHLPLLWAC